MLTACIATLLLSCGDPLEWSLANGQQSAPGAQGVGAGQVITKRCIFPGIDPTGTFAAATLHGRRMWPHPDQDGDGVDDLLSTAGGAWLEPPDPRRGAFDLISSSTGRILAGGEFGGGISWDFFVVPGADRGAPSLVSYSLELDHASQLRIHRWAIQDGESGATFVSSLCAEIPLPEQTVGETSYWFGPKLLHTSDPRRAYLAFSVDRRRCLVQLDGDLLKPTLSMAWPRPDRPWLPETVADVYYEWVVLPDLNSDGFDELAVGPSDPPIVRPKEPLPPGVAPVPEPPARLLVLSGKDFYVLREVDLPGFGRRDVVALAAGNRAEQGPGKRRGLPQTNAAASPRYTLFAYCAPIHGQAGGGTVFRIDPSSGQVDGTLTSREIGRKVRGPSAFGQGPFGSSRDQSLLCVDGSNPLLVFGNPDIGLGGGAACIDPISARVMWTADANLGEEMAPFGDYEFGAQTCWLRAEIGLDLVAIASPYIQGGQSSISFFRLWGGDCTLRIDCWGE